MSSFEKYNYWLDLADADLTVAKYLFIGKHYLYCGYFCHQVIEKGFKAIVAKITQEIPPKIHDLPKLALKGNLWAKLNDEQKELLKKIIPLQIEARYPEYKEKIAKSLTKKYCEEIVKGTEALLCWIKQQ